MRGPAASLAGTSGAATVRVRQHPSASAARLRLRARAVHCPAFCKRPRPALCIRRVKVGYPAAPAMVSIINAGHSLLEEEAERRAIFERHTVVVLAIFCREDGAAGIVVATQRCSHVAFCRGCWRRCWRRRWTLARENVLRFASNAAQPRLPNTALHHDVASISVPRAPRILHDPVRHQLRRRRCWRRWGRRHFATKVVD